MVWRSLRRLNKSNIAISVDVMDIVDYSVRSPKIPEGHKTGYPSLGLLRPPTRENTHPILVGVGCIFLAISYFNRALELTAADCVSALANNLATSAFSASCCVCCAETYQTAKQTCVTIPINEPTSSFVKKDFNPI